MDWKRIFKIVVYFALFFTIREFLVAVILELTVEPAVGVSASPTDLLAVYSPDLLAAHYREFDFSMRQSDFFYSLAGGYQIWLENPLFGGGLGHVIENQKSIRLVIHNSVLWILAEMGLFGLLLFLVLPYFLFREAVGKGLKISRNRMQPCFSCF